MLPPGGRTLATLVAVTLVATVQACSSPRPSATPPPRSEFLLNTADSTFWVKTGAQTSVRGAPLVLAAYDRRFYELYTADDDYSYPDATLLGERLYRRDLLTGDSMIVFSDTTVPRIAAAYAKAHPDERPLNPDDEGDEDPKTSATAELDVLGVFGPYLSYEYHVDVETPNAPPWHAIRRGVLDLRSGKPALVADLFGDSTGARLTATARQAFGAMRDSVLGMRASLEGDDRRAADAFARLDFDARSFTLTNVGGQPAVAFGVPARGGVAAGNLVELEPLKAEPTPWWRSVASGFSTADDADNDRWIGNGYRIIARYDTSGEVARLSIADVSRREWPLGSMIAPLRRVDWLDRPAITDTTRRALLRAFDAASNYDENARVAAAPPTHRPAASSVPRLPIHLARNHARNQEREGKPARVVGAHDAAACEQHGTRVRRRDPLDDGQVRGDRRLSAQPRECGHGVDRSRRLSRADLRR